MAGDAGGLSADVLTGEGEEAEGEDECACAPMRRVCAVRNSISAVATRFCDTVLTRAVMKEKLLEMIWFFFHGKDRKVGKRKSGEEREEESFRNELIRRGFALDIH